MKYIDFITKLSTFWILDKDLRRKRRKDIKTRIYGKGVFENAKSIGKNLWVGGYSFVNENTIIGDGVCFNGMQVHGDGNVKFGNYIHSGVECLIITRNHNYEGDLIPYDETYVYKEVEIGDFVWLGSRVMILPGTKIGEGAIIQGGSVVHGEIPPYAIAGGNPAKVFKYRDIEHFKKLKAEGKILNVLPETLAAVERERERERVIPLTVK